MTDWRFIVTKTPGKVLRRLRGRPEGWEPHVWKTARRIRGETFIDVGANVGRYAVGLHRNFSHVYAVEPSPEAIFRLKMIIARTGAWNVTVLPFAAADTNGKAPFFIDETPGKCNGSADTIEQVFVYHPASNPAVNMETIGRLDPAHGGKPFMVETRRLDDYEFPGPITLVKIDVEGAEFRVLEGLRKNLVRHNVKHLIVELHNRDRALELETLLFSYGYGVRWLDPDHLFAWVS